MTYVRLLPANWYQVGGNSERVSFVLDDRRVSLDHDQAINLAGWLLGTVLLQSDSDEEPVDRFRQNVAQASGRRSPL